MLSMHPNYPIPSRRRLRNLCSHTVAGAWERIRTGVTRIAAQFPGTFRIYMVALIESSQSPGSRIESCHSRLEDKVHCMHGDPV